MILLSFILSFFFISSLAAGSDDWHGKSIYQVITDRFAISNDSSVPCDTSKRKYCGGSWNGITTHLDYIQSMGFDAIWISPVSANIEGETSGGEAFHGYWTQDMNSLNPHFGTADDLKNLSASIHARGMYLMFDVVINHMAATALPPAFNFSTFQPFSNLSDYHRQCFVSDYNNQTDVEQCWLGDKNLPLPDLDTEDQNVIETLYQWIQDLVKEYNVDGLRIDTVKHIRKDFWPAFSSAAGVFTLGEVISDNTTYTSGYTEVVDAVLDYPTWFNLTAAFSSPTGNLSALVETVYMTQSTYKNGAFMTGSFLENHDQPRFASMTQDQALVKNAMTWPFVYDGIPIVYYGQEQGYQGSGDPSNREALWFTAYDTQKPLVAHVKALNAARKAAIAANSSYLSTPMKFLTQTSNSTLAISKPPLLTLLTNAGSNSNGPTYWNVTDAGFTNNETLVDLLTCKRVQADEEGGVSVQAFYGEPQILIPASALNKTGSLCPTAATGGASRLAGMSRFCFCAAVFLGLALL